MLKPSHTENPIRNRKITFDYIYKRFKSKDGVFIIETGCMRNDHGDLSFGDDGCSTFIFDRLARYTNGKFFSCDLSIKNINFAKDICKNTNFVESDSVLFLTTFNDIDKVDLLYLDSYDYDPANPLPSQNHHLKEIKSVMGKLKSGALILIDDADAMLDGTYRGKATLVIDYFSSLGITPIIKSYQVLFQIP